jgi:hypothetical protein
MRFFNCNFLPGLAVVRTSFENGKLSIVCCLLLLAMSLPAFAQSTEGAITGTIVDISGAIVSKATVTVTNVDTGLTYKATSTNDGTYTVPSLPPGAYKVEVQAPGFATFIQTQLNIDVAQRLRVDAKLKIGTSSETVTVSGGVPMLQTEQSSLGSIVDSQQIQDLPLDGRQPFTLALLVPGVRPTNNGADGFADASNQSFSRIQINGGSTLGNQFFLDGAQDTVPAINEVSVIPMADSILQFKVETNSLEAEFGQTSGGVINLATKSGTNTIHGTAYEFVRNDALNARNRFSVPDPITGRLRPVLHYNQFGGTIGGPVWFPKLYNGHDRTFFFFGYEQWHYKGTAVQFATVPTVAERNGDFSGLVDANGALIKIYDPATTLPTAPFPRKQFPGNKVDPARFDKLALSVLKYMPLPNVTPSTPQGILTNTSNYISQKPSPIDQDVIAARIDHQLSRKDSIFARYAGNINATSNLGLGLGVADPQARTDHRNNHNLAIGETHIFSPTILNEFRISGTRQNLTYSAPSVGGNWPATLGYSSIIPADEFPAVQISGYAGLGYQASSSPSEGGRIQNTVQIADSVTVIHGRNSIKFGIDHRVTRLNYLSQTFPSGQFSFNTSLTSYPPTPAGSGNAFASFLLGQVAGGSQTSSPAFSAASWSEGLYVQDDFKAAPNLTFNIGLRYDIFGPPTDRHNWHSNFFPNVTNPVTGTPGALVYAGVTAPRQFVNPHYVNFGPRFGMALSANRKTVFSGGVGLIYNSVESGDMHGNAFNSLGFSSTTTFSSSSATNNAFTFAQGPSVLVTPVGVSGGPSAYRGQSVNFQDPRGPMPYDVQWNVTVQRQLLGSWVAAASYVGNHGVHLFGANYNANQLNPAYFAQYGSALQTSVPNPYYGQIATGALAGKTITLQQSLLPFPDYIGITTLARHGADSNYQSLQAFVEHRQGHGITLRIGYTKAKLIDDSNSNSSGESTDAGLRYGFYNQHVERSVDQNDLAQRLVGSGSWKLPSGGLHGWKKQALANYQLNGTTTWQTGTPLSVTGSNNFTGSTYPNLLSNVSPTLPNGQRSTAKWFNTAAFVNPPNYVVGNSPRTLRATRGPGFASTNLSLMKLFTKDTWTLQIRAEAFNVFNHPNLGNPGTAFVPNAQGTNSSATFGVINSAQNGRAIQLGAHLAW